MYGTTTSRSHADLGFDVFISQDLANWREPLPVYRKKDDFWAVNDYWGPEIHFYQGEYYLFATFTGVSSLRGVGIMKSASPEGPFKGWSEGAVTPADWMCLDGTLYIDKENNPWMVFCHEWLQVKDGTICAIRLEKNLRSSFGDSIVLFSASSSPWSRMCEFENYTGWITDACFMHRLTNGKLLMIWSSLGREGYCIFQTFSESGEIFGPWKHNTEPLYKEDGGSGMIFKTREGQLKLVFHSPNTSPFERAVFMDIREGEDWLYFT